MANYCITKYWVTGSLKTLQKLATLIGEEGHNILDIYHGLHLPMTEVDFRGEGQPYWLCASIQDGVLTFTEEARWEQSRCLWKLKNKMKEINDIYYYSAVCENNLYETNDATGRFFPYRYTVFCSEIPDNMPDPIFYVVDDSNTYFFISESDILDFFRKSDGWGASSINELEKVADKNGYCLKSQPIEVVEQPVNYGINRLSISFEPGENGHINVTIKQTDP